MHAKLEKPRIKLSRMFLSIMSLIVLAIMILSHQNCSSSFVPSPGQVNQQTQINDSNPGASSDGGGNGGGYEGIDHGGELIAGLSLRCAPIAAGDESHLNLSTRLYLEGPPEGTLNGLVTDTAPVDPEFFPAPGELTEKLVFTTKSELGSNYSSANYQLLLVEKDLKFYANLTVTVTVADQETVQQETKVISFVCE